MVRNGVRLALTAWLAATMNPSGGSYDVGICANGTKPFQSYRDFQPGAGQ